MMGARLRLDCFDDAEGRGAPAGTAGPAPAILAEDERLAAYEKGYAAGWEDAIAAQERDALRLREDLSHNLRDLAFTFQEARAHVLRSLEPLLRTMVDRVLPEVARAGFGAAVAAEALASAGTAATAPVEILVAPENVAAVGAALGDDPALPVRLVGDPMLAGGQARFRMGGEEGVFDHDALIATIRGHVHDFLNQSLEGQALHG